LAIGADVEVPLESWFDGGEGEPLVFLALADFFVESFGLFGEDADMGVAMAVASLVSLVADLWEEVVAGRCLYLFLPLVSRVDLLRFGVCALVAAAVVLLVSLALGSFLVAVAEAEGGGGGGAVCPSLGAPEAAAPPPRPPDRVLAMDQ
jgi:hypothetical protein